MKLEDIKTDGRYVFNHSSGSDEFQGEIVIVQNAKPGVFGMIDCITEDGVEGAAFPDELSPLPEEN